MIKAIIIDDEPLARSLVKEYLASYTDIEVMAECNDGFEGMKAIQEHQPDLLFLDIQMPKINGFEMLELLDQPPAVIFTTAYDEYAIRAFDNHAVDYLLKPFSKERFDKALAKWKVMFAQKDTAPALKDVMESAANSPLQRERIVVKSGSSIVVIPVDDIMYLEAADDFVKIHTRKGHWLKNKTMAHFEQQLDANRFIRVHRSYIVNISEITRLDPYEKDSHILLLKTGVSIPISKTGMVKLKEILS
jgi:two-component system LytT family response regulator